MNAIASTTPVPAMPIPATTVPAVNKADNRSSYISFAAAFILGHGTAALSKGADPVLPLPAWVPLTLLGVGVVAGLVLTMRAGARAKRGADQSELLAEKLVGTSWVTGFVALALAITGVATAFDLPELQDVLWPAGSVLVVGLINLAEGAVRRNTLHYGLGTWLALISSASLFLDTPGVYSVLAIAGGAGYIVAAALERRRLAA
ncbi:ABC transporter permease [Sphaerimonospora sp. CA-214678]|uniref:ABC transporter permease n=1 Tax=Sphaerimonospora sp. CA-214678 TaxID=3240029 RepID=UPI003D8F6D61